MRFFAVCGRYGVIPTGVFLCSILLSYLPAPRNIEKIVGGAAKEKGIHLAQENLLKRLSRLSQGANASKTAVVIVIIAVIAVYLNTQVKIGNPVEGSNLLWHESEFNTGVRAINAHFPGTNTLEIILESKTQDIDHRVTNTPDVVRVGTEIQRRLELDPELPPRATLTFSDYMREINRLFSGGNPKWQPLDLTPQAIKAAGFAALLGSNAINFGHVADFEFQDSTVTLWFKDNKQETVDQALESARRAVEAVGEDHPEFRVRLGSGVIALQQAINDVVERYHWLIMVMVNGAVLLISAFAYRSLVASLILLIPVNLSNLLLVAAIYLMGIGLDIKRRHRRGYRRRRRCRLRDLSVVAHLRRIHNAESRPGKKRWWPR